MIGDITFVLYKNGRRYSNIKFSSEEEVLKFMDFNLGDNYSFEDYYDIFEYPYGFFRKRYMIKETKEGLVFSRKMPFKEPRKRHFNK